jgi:DNA repair exonuclease SbcCD nuclease subunit
VIRILHTGDWHLDKSTAGVARFDDVARAAQQTVDHAIREKVDLYCFTGDLADPDSGPVVLRCAELAIDLAVQLSDAGIPSWWIAGNHDVCEDGTGTTTLSPLRKLRSEVRVVERPIVCRGAAMTSILLPYPSMADAYDPIEFVAEADVAEGLPVFVAGHLTQLEGVVPGEETNEMPRGRGIPWPVVTCDPSWLIAGGHWHDRQVVKVAGRQFHVCGSLARLTFGEERNEPSFNIYELGK